MRKVILFLLAVTVVYATKITDVANIVGVRDNHLIGYSLVVGLKKTGDGTTSKFTLQSIANMLKAMNIDMDPVDIKSKNVAAVVVTAELAPFSRQGDKFNITVSSIGDAKSLEGGTLLMTPLKGV
ncbi:MAG: flagellar basal body P-ring protein FlgI, partial [Sulfurimonas sp.]|nr:flagellar basal body P-ring protein FlgI [Sulfurimonas sp.]